MKLFAMCYYYYYCYYSPHTLLPISPFLYITFRMIFFLFHFFLSLVYWHGGIGGHLTKVYVLMEGVGSMIASAPAVGRYRKVRQGRRSGYYPIELGSRRRGLYSALVARSSRIRGSGGSRNLRRLQVTPAHISRLYKYGSKAWARRSTESRVYITCPRVLKIN